MGDKHLWSYDGQVALTIGLSAVAGKPPEQWGMDPIRYEDMIPGCYHPVAHVADMDVDVCRHASIMSGSGIATIQWIIATSAVFGAGPWQP